MKTHDNESLEVWTLLPEDVQAILNIMPDTWRLEAFASRPEESRVGYIDIYDGEKNDYHFVMNPKNWDEAYAEFCAWVRDGCREQA